MVSVRIYIKVKMILDSIMKLSGVQAVPQMQQNPKQMKQSLLVIAKMNLCNSQSQQMRQMLIQT